MRKRGWRETLPRRNLETMRVDYSKVINMNHVLEDDCMSMVITTLMYATQEKALDVKI